MRMSQLFSRSLREAPSQALLTSHRLLARAGYVQEIGIGGFAVLPIGRRALQNLEQVFLSHLNTAFEPIEIPTVLAHEGAPPAIEGLRFSDAQGRQLHLPLRLDTVMAEIARQNFTSYRQLPVYLLSTGPLWEDEVHPGSGLLYGRTPHTLALYGFFQQSDECREAHQQVSSAVEKTLKSLQIPFLCTFDPGLSSNGMMQNVEWYFPHPAGRRLVYKCPGCGYTSSEAMLKFLRVQPWQEPFRPLQKVETPNCKTIDALAAFLQIPRERTAKAIFLMGTIAGKEQLVIALIPGDRELDEKRLAAALGMLVWRAAAESEITVAGAVPGYGSAVGLNKVCVVVDCQIPLSPNLAAGANEPGFHLLNVNFERDYNASLIAEITHPKPGDRCPYCREVMRTEACVTVCALSQPDSRHVIMDAQGKITALHTLACRFSTLKLVAAAAETHHDEHGLLLPPAAAPFPVHLVLLADKQGLAQTQADNLENQLIEAGLEPLYDDRNERAGVKFNDADLIGIPVRITISQRSVTSGMVEVKLRWEEDPRQVPTGEVISQIQHLLIK